MYFVTFLRAKDQAGGDQVEYRLACSGELYNRNVQPCDWRKSDATRILLRKPFTLLVASWPFDTYPQELCARLTVARVTEQGGREGATSSVSFLPDRDIVEDVCAILTLLSRRLISPVVKTMERPCHGSPNPWFGSHVPIPIVDRFKVVAWPRRPLTVTTSTSGHTVKFNEPPPVGVDDNALATFLTHLGTKPRAQSIVYAARQYKAALELIEDRPDTAYLALVSVVETLASFALAKFPSDSEKIAKKAHVAERARNLGLSEEQASELALEAARDDKWLTRKFVKFCMDYCPVSEVMGPDPLFILPEFLKPAESDFEDCLTRIYSARSKNLHVARPFPRGVGIGTGPMIAIRDLPRDPLGKLELPPATWFERVVSVAARRFLIPNGPAPFSDAYSAASTEASVS